MNSQFKQSQQYNEHDIPEEDDLRFTDAGNPRNSMQQYTSGGYRQTVDQSTNGQYGGQAHGTSKSKNVVFDCSDGEPLQLVSVDPKGNFELKVEAFEVHSFT